MKKRLKNKKGGERIVLTGGHAATTALATIEELVKRGNDGHFWNVYWIGVSKAVEGKQVPTLEAAIFPEMGISFHPIVAGRLQRRLSIWTIPSLLKIPVGLLQTLILLIKIRPRAILSFGGFAAFPVVLAGWFLRIPVVIHEQTHVAGRANRLSAYLARRIALAAAESIKFFPAKKCVVVGNPILAEIAEVSPKDKPADPPTIYVTGGSRGAQPINRLIEEIVERLTRRFVVIHHTGSIDFEKFKKLRETLPEKLREKYEVYGQIDPKDVDGVYRRADIIVARSGANTVAEIVQIRRPAILIPLPFSYLDEQTKNAKYAQKLGVARVLKQEGLSGDKLLLKIQDVYENWNEIRGGMKDTPTKDEGAAARLVDLLEENV